MVGNRFWKVHSSTIAGTVYVWQSSQIFVRRFVGVDGAPCKSGMNGRPAFAVSIHAAVGWGLPHHLEKRCAPIAVGAPVRAER